MSVSELGAKGEGDTVGELAKPRFEAGGVGEPATAALAGAARFGMVSAQRRHGHPSPSFSNLGFASARERALSRKRRGGCPVLRGRRG